MSRFNITDTIHPMLMPTFVDNIQEQLERYERMVYADQFALNEGLILTHPVIKALRVLDNSGFYVSETDENKFYVECSYTTTDFDKLLKITQNLGWFVVQIRNKRGDKSIKYSTTNLHKMLDEYESVYLLFEPKYDIELNRNDYKFLYHFTHKKNLGRIKKQGLTPRTASKTSNHPERVYLAFTANGAEKIGRKIVNRTITRPVDSNISVEDYKTGVILQIYCEMIPSYFKLYADPNYKNAGCFTLNTIPPDSIRSFKEFDLD